jgi:DNA repair exonuclease SbcCD ATPase subunit
MANYDSNFDSRNQETHVVDARPKRSFATPILAAGLIGVGGFAAYQNSEISDLRREIGVHRQDVVALRSNLSTADGELQRTLGAMREEFSSTEKLTSEAMSKAQAAARRHAETLASKLEKQQAERQRQLSAELSTLRQSDEETSQKLSGINTDVDTVKTEVSTTKTQVDKSLNDLQRVTGDLGVMSGLIATNSKEIQDLRELGDRNIYEFTLAKSAGTQKVGDIQLELRKADAKKNRYTVNVFADDKTIEKKDRTTNEPVQFYVASKARQPYELVVNQVTKNEVKGYLATPKVTIARK